MVTTLRWLKSSPCPNHVYTFSSQIRDLKTRQIELKHFVAPFTPPAPHQRSFDDVTAFPLVCQTLRIDPLPQRGSPRRALTADTRANLKASWIPKSNRENRTEQNEAERRGRGGDKEREAGERESRKMIRERGEEREGQRRQRRKTLFLWPCRINTLLGNERILRDFCSRGDSCGHRKEAADRCEGRVDG